MDLNLNEMSIASHYDPSYFPAPTEINKITENMWNIDSLGPIPSWLGFSGAEHGSYELRDDNINICINGLTGVTEVKKIFCPYLERAFALKKQHKKSLGYDCVERYMYHACIPENIDSICIHNFNWRFFGRSRGHKHGQGVSFSPYTSFANMFCKSPIRKRMIEAVVLFHQSHIGENHHKLPLPGYDSTRSPNGNVLVKFEDSEFVPLRLICYGI